MVSEMNERINPSQKKVVTKEEEVYLIAQPRNFKPFLTSEIEKGIFKTVESGSKGKIWFTDIGENIWKTALEMDKAAVIVAKKKGRFSTQRQWEASVFTKGLEILCTSEKYKGTLGGVHNYFIHLRFKGNIKVITKFIKKFVPKLGYEPWEMDDWGEFGRWFNKKIELPGTDFWSFSLAGRITGAKLEIEFQNKWKKLLEIPQCPNCGELIEKEYKFCPHCRTKLKNICSSCGREVSPDFTLCPFCGAKSRAKRKGE